MKKIIKEIKLLMKIYKCYRLMITNDSIELKITPKLDSEKEINWMVDNNKGEKFKVLLSLRELSSEHGL